MPSIHDIRPGQTFSFEVYPTSILGNHFRDVQLEGSFTAQSALAFGFDVEAYHANIYPTLPQGLVPDDPFGYDYIRIRYPSGEYAMIGMPWIRPETIVVSQAQRITLVFENKTSSDRDRILLALNSNGYRPDAVMSDA